MSSLTGQGTENTIFVANRGDTVDSRAVIRFDSIPARYGATAGDTTTTPITTVDSARLRFAIDTLGAKLPGPVTIDAYDVNTDAPDSLTSAVAALFTPDRLIASQTYEKDSLKDSVFLSIPGPVILAHAGQRLRIGLRARAAGSVQFRIFSVESGAGELLRFRVSPDTSIKAIVLVPLSNDASRADADCLQPFRLHASGQGTRGAPPGTLAIGGLPATRVYMRFNVPTFIVDTAQIVRATLLLTQRPNRSVDPGDTIRNRRERLARRQHRYGFDACEPDNHARKCRHAQDHARRQRSQGAGGCRVISLWRSQTVTRTPRALVLTTTTEGQLALEARFFSIEAAPALRPRLRISYSTRKSNGLP